MAQFCFSLGGINQVRGCGFQEAKFSQIFSGKYNLAYHHRMPINYRTATLLASLVYIQAANALEPDQVFRRAAPSVVMVLAAGNNQGSQGSGVVVSPQRVVTNCHVAFNKAGKPYHQIVIRQAGTQWSARYIAGNLDYDTCLLAVPGLPAPPVQLADLGTLRIGQRVYAIGAPVGLELTLTDGLLSAFRKQGKSRVIQTSAPISRGSSGGGLFDDQARLIGITSFLRADGNSLGFAYFADPIIGMVASSMPEDDQAAMAATIQAALSKALANARPPKSSFMSSEEAIKWLTNMSQKLESTMPDKEIRFDFLSSAHYEATRAGLDPQLILSLIDEVSEFKKYAVKPNGARGYMQVQPAWIELVGRPDDNLFHLRTNLRYGCTILRHYLDLEAGDLYRALMRYDVAMRKGPGNDLDDKSSDFPNRVRYKWHSQWVYSR